MSEFERKDVIAHLMLLANSKDAEYLRVRKEWDENSISYAWCLIQNPEPPKEQGK